jgi:DNA-binding MarR family transcriptional regulator
MGAHRLNGRQGASKPRPKAGHGSGGTSQRRSGIRANGSSVSGTRANGKRASDIHPADSRLREFVADLYAAMSMMRLLRQEIASKLSLSTAEYSVLLAVWYLERKSEMTVRAIADHLHVAAAYVTSEISRLVQKGLLTKSPDSRDRRAVEVGLTKEGRALLSRLEPMLREVNRPLFEGLSVQDFGTAHSFIRAIIENGEDAIRSAQAFKPD